MNEELTLEKLADLAVYYPVYLIDAAAMLDMEVELPAELMDDPYLCAWFMREFAYWLLQYVDDYCKLSQDE